MSNKFFTIITALLLQGCCSIDDNNKGEKLSASSFLWGMACSVEKDQSEKKEKEKIRDENIRKNIPF